MIWKVTGKVKIKQAMICFLAKKSTAFKKNQRLIIREGGDGKG